MKMYFAIIGAMRTGSNLLERTLEGLGDTICYGEPFNPAFVGGPRKTDLLGWDIARRDADPSGFLEALISAEPMLIPGFRIFDGHTPQVLDKVLSDPRCHRIVLTRDPLDSFVSLRIARATDQWILRNPKRRQRARIHFDLSDYQGYQKRLADHYAHVDRTMAQSGMDAYRVSYDRLSDPVRLLQVAEHIGSAGKPTSTPPLLRQNPGHLSSKVENYEEMCAALGMDPKVPVADLTHAGDILVPDHVPIAIASLPGPALVALSALVQRIEVRGFDRAQLSRSALLAAVGKNRLFRSGISAQDLGQELSGRRLMAMTCHPALRAVGMFAETLFDREWKGSSLRYALLQACPGLANLDENVPPMDPQLFQDAFDCFLTELARPPHLPEHGPRHASQAALLQEYRALLDGLEVVRLEDFDGVANTLCKAAEIAPLPRGQVNAVRCIGNWPSVDPAKVLSDACLKRIETMWREDYHDLGYKLGTMPS